MESNLKTISSFGARGSLLLLFAFPIYPLPVTNIIFISFAFFSLLSWVSTKCPSIWKALGRNIIFALPFAPYLIELCFYHSNAVVGFEVEKKLLFFTAPFAFAFYTSSLKLFNFRVYIRTFCISMILLSVYSILLLITNKILFDPAYYAGDASTLRIKFEDIARLHPTYFGLFASISMLWLIYDHKNLTRKLKWISGFSICILLFVDVLIAAKMSLIILFAGTVVILYKTTTQKKHLVIPYGVLLAVFTILIVVIPSSRERLYEMIHILYSKNVTYNSVNERKIIFNCSWNIFKNNIWLGVGCRNTQQFLNAFYWSIQYYPAFIKNYNSHNQFLTLGLNYGIFDVFLFLGSIGAVLYRQRKNIFAIVLIGSIVMIMLTESILERQMGVYFFALFTLLLFNIDRREESAKSLIETSTTN